MGKGPRRRFWPIPDIDASILEGLNKRSYRPKDVVLADGFFKIIDCEP